MLNVPLGSKVYFIPEEEDLYLFEDLYEWPPEVVVQDETGKFVPVHDEFTIAMVKMAAMVPPVLPKTAVPDWRRKLERWLKERIAAGDVREVPTKNGKCWLITLPKEAVFCELDLEKISLDTFKRQVQPKNFKYRELPLKWASQGGRPKTMDR